MPPASWRMGMPYAGLLIEDEADRVRAANKKIAALPGPLVIAQAASSVELERNSDAYCLNWLLEEVSTRMKTAAAGGMRA